MSIDTSTGSQRIIRGFSFTRAKERLMMLAVGAGVLMFILGAVGAILALANSATLDQQDTLRTAAQTLLIMATVMVVCVGALCGHLTILRSNEQIDRGIRELRDSIHKLRAEEADQTDVLNGLAGAADQLTQRRNGR